MFPEDSISILCCSRLFHMHIITILLIFPPTIYRGRVMNCGGSQRENGGGAAKQGRKKNQKEEPIQSDNRSENGREKHGQWREIASKQKEENTRKRKKKKKRGYRKKTMKGTKGNRSMLKRQVIVVGQKKMRPQKSLCLIFPSAFVRTSTSCSAPFIQEIFRLPCQRCSFTKWNSRSMCLVRFMLERLDAIFTAAWLSEKSIGHGSPRMIFFNSEEIHSASTAAYDKAMYSAWHVDRATQSCHREPQWIGTSQIVQIKPWVDR